MLMASADALWFEMPSKDPPRSIVALGTYGKPARRHAWRPVHPHAFGSKLLTTSRPKTACRAIQGVIVLFDG